MGVGLPGADDNENPTHQTSLQGVDDGSDLQNGTGGNHGDAQGQKDKRLASESGEDGEGLADEIPNLWDANRMTTGRDEQSQNAGSYEEFEKQILEEEEEEAAFGVWDGPQEQLNNHSGGQNPRSPTSKRSENEDESTGHHRTRFQSSSDDSDNEEVPMGTENASGVNQSSRFNSSIVNCGNTTTAPDPLSQTHKPHRHERHGSPDSLMNGGEGQNGLQERDSDGSPNPQRGGVRVAGRKRRLSSSDEDSEDGTLVIDDSV